MGEVTIGVAAGRAAGAKARSAYLPLWVVTATGQSGDPARYFLPAFRHRRLAALCDLGLNLSRKDPVFEHETARPAALGRCTLDEEDARTFAQFVAFRLRSERAAVADARAREPITVTAVSLVWFPFAEDGYSLRDPYAGTSFPKRLLL